MTESRVPEIRQLSSSVVNKIAAGEVIERPASVVKELMENAIDAGAERIDVTVEQGGSDLIRVSDDGCGMRAEQLPLAVASHATSKIQDADDLFRVATLGFRGEALASIAEVSHLRMVTRTRDETHGSQLEVQGGIARPITPFGCPPGTTMEVRHLFFNTPVRRKFLRTTQTELGHITEAFLRIALPHPQVHCTLRHGDRPIHDLPPSESWRERIQSTFGADVGEKLIWVDSDDGDLSLSGYVGDPSCNRANNRFQYFFLNGRHIRDRSLQHALGEAYRGLLMQGRFPIAFLSWRMPPDAVDVNVHPTKLEVRFRDGSRIYSQLLSAIRNRFLASDLTARIRPPTDRESANIESIDARAASSAMGASAANWRANNEPVGGQQRGPMTGEWAVNQSMGTGSPIVGPRSTDTAAFPGTNAPARPFLAESESDRRSLLTGWTWPSRDGAPTAEPGPATDFEWAVDGPHGTMPHGTIPHGTTRQPGMEPSEPMGEVSRPTLNSPELGRTSRDVRYGMQVHNRYLIAEDESGLLVIDQHALHERILYEQLKLKLEGGTLETQRLLVPEPVTLTPAESAIALDHAATLAELGIEVESFGGETILVTAYPALLKRVDPSEILRQAVSRLIESDVSADPRDLVDELLQMMSCKAAVKAGDPLSPEEVTALLQHRDLCRDAHHCPHGRPTALVFTRGELDKRFKRV